MKYEHLENVVSALLETCGICDVLDALADCHRALHQKEAEAISNLSLNIWVSRFSNDEEEAP